MVLTFTLEFHLSTNYDTGQEGDITTNVLGVCHRNLNFTYVLPSWKGSATNDRVLRDVVVQRNGLKIPEGMPCIYAYKNTKRMVYFIFF
ncbi:hypothetical protein RDI58_028843 [Solanum bulbocastanum]|uniref:Uncharacterized protein n=1 Tax=Solanum bulbocastanum TaxID=147425 RepID=A0AAN8XZ26_SOLBU